MPDVREGAGLLATIPDVPDLLSTPEPARGYPRRDQVKLVDAMTDPIADMLTRIRNSQQAKHSVVEIPRSRLKAEIARVLQAEGYIRDYSVAENQGHGVIRIRLKYGPARQHTILGLERVSKSGCRVYVGWTELPRVARGGRVAILSTPRGIMTDRAARANKVGGELLCVVW